MSLSKRFKDSNKEVVTSVLTGDKDLVDITNKQLDNLIGGTNIAILQKEAMLNSLHFPKNDPKNYKKRMQKR